MQPTAANIDDVASIDQIVTSLYTIISGEPGIKRDWKRLRSLFIPGGGVIRFVAHSNCGFVPIILSIDEYIEISGNYVDTMGLFQTEIARRAENFGHAAHVLSTFIVKHKVTDKKPFLRGVNSIQLVKVSNRWWIISVVGDNERQENSIPEKYLLPEKQT